MSRMYFAQEDTVESLVRRLVRVLKEDDDLTRVNAAIEELSDDLKKHRKYIETMSVRIEKIEDVNSDLKKKIEKLENENNELKAQIGHIENITDQFDKAPSYKTDASKNTKQTKEPKKYSFFS